MPEELLAPAVLLGEERGGNHLDELRATRRRAHPNLWRAGMQVVDRVEVRILDVQPEDSSPRAVVQVGGIDSGHCLVNGRRTCAQHVVERAEIPRRHLRVIREERSLLICAIEPRLGRGDVTPEALDQLLLLLFREGLAPQLAHNPCRGRAREPREAQPRRLLRNDSIGTAEAVDVLQNGRIDDSLSRRQAGARALPIRRWNHLAETGVKDCGRKGGDV
mmetsp:Transcript_3322/g.10283  ORF Transcript_3322/g.10283 Transcript_3322/m.10283 type:complete len:219 (+) Transcript_3322:1714-2370(+)